MSELEQLASRIVMIDRGCIAFDGEFGQLRRVYGDRRSLVLETTTSTPPELHGAKLIVSEHGRHQYRFDATKVSVSELLQQAAQHTEVIDVETQRAPIDQVIANMYQTWAS